MKHGWMILGVVLVVFIALALAACGGGDDRAAAPPGGATGGDSSQGAAATAPATAPTLEAVFSSRDQLTAGRQLPAPSGDPAEFEAPFSVGTFVRQSLRGRAVAPQTAGQMAVYSNGDDVIVLNVMVFRTPTEAMNTVRYVLEEADPLLRPISPPLYGPQRSFGITQDRHGGFTAAWNTDRWAFTARADKSSEALNAFLELFAY